MPATSIDNGTTIIDIPLNKISEDGDNVRTEYDQAELEELAESIMQHGLIQPITVYGGPDIPNGDGSYAVYMGHRRYRALNWLRSEKKIKASEPIRCIVDNDAINTAGSVSSTGVARMLIENLQRVDLTAIDEARGYQKMIEDHGYTQRDLAASVGKSPGHIAKRVALLSLPDELRARVQHTIDIDVAYRMSKLDDDQITKIAKGFESGKFTFNNIAYEVTSQEHTQSARRRKEKMEKAIEKAMIEVVKELPDDVDRAQFERLASYTADTLKDYVPKKNHVCTRDPYNDDRIQVWRKLTTKQLETKRLKQEKALEEQIAEEQKAEEEWLENEADEVELWYHKRDELIEQHTSDKRAFEQAVSGAVGGFIADLEPKQVNALLVANIASQALGRFGGDAKHSCEALGINPPDTDDDGNEITSWDRDWSGSLKEWIGTSMPRALQAWLVRNTRSDDVARFDVFGPLRDALADKGAVPPVEPDIEAILGPCPEDGTEDEVVESETDRIDASSF